MEDQDPDKALQDLCKQWLAAKADEADASKLRIKIEQEIVKLAGAKDEGSATSTHGGFKIETTGVINRRMDWEKWSLVKREFPPELCPIRTKEELDPKGVKWLEANRPDLYAKLPIEVKPGKTSVKITPTPTD